MSDTNNTNENSKKLIEEKQNSEESLAPKRNKGSTNLLPPKTKDDTDADKSKEPKKQ